MKIEIELPDWVNDRDIAILAGTEQVAYKLVADNNIYVKTSRCNGCGDCCPPRGGGKHYFPVKEDGMCIHLIPDGEKQVCDLGPAKPWACCVGDQMRHTYGEACSVRYEKR